MEQKETPNVLYFVVNTILKRISYDTIKWCLVHPTGEWQYILNNAYTNDANTLKESYAIVINGSKSYLKKLNPRNIGSSTNEIKSAQNKLTRQATATLYLRTHEACH